MSRSAPLSLSWLAGAVVWRSHRSLQEKPTGEVPMTAGTPGVGTFCRISASVASAASLGEVKKYC